MGLWTVVDSSSARRAAPLLGMIALLALVWLAFGETVTSPFLSYDDPHYVTRNDVVRQGLSWSGVGWAFTSGHAANWHPLTWISHMADVSLYGLDVRGHHVTSLILHSLNAILVFVLLRAATGAAGASLVVAGLFTVHPTRLESVVWIAERKDLLSTFFGLLALIAWVRWTRAGGRALYAMAVGLYAASLMAKPMLVTLPVLLLLLDFWPLQRIGGGAPIGGLLREKAPFFLLSAASCVVTTLVQRAGGAVMGLQAFPLSERLANAPLALGDYLVDLVWPGPRAIFYPHPGPEVSWAGAATVAVLLVLVTAALFRLRNRWPYAFFGWAWFLVALLPVLGIVQVGLQARADRYTYLPYLGLFTAAVFAATAAARRRGVGDRTLAVGALALVIALAVTTRAQSAQWRDGRTLFEHSRALTGPNAVVEYALGLSCLDAGDVEAAERHLRSALELGPRHTGARLALGRVLVVTGRVDEAARAYETVLAEVPGYVEANNNLAFCRLRQGQLDQARELFSRAVAVNPGLAAATHVLGMLEAALGPVDEALPRLSAAVRLSPGNREWALDLEGAEALVRGGNPAAERRFRSRLGAYHREAAAALEERGRPEAARSHIMAAERIEPGPDQAPLVESPARVDTTTADGLSR